MIDRCKEDSLMTRLQGSLLLLIASTAIMSAISSTALGSTPDVAEAPEREHAKLNTEDASPVDPGHFEFELAYSFTQAGRQFDNRWDTTRRRYTREHAFEIGLTCGIVENLDAGVGIGLVDVYDRDNDHYEDDENHTGPHYGTGISDVAVSAKWRFYHNERLKLEVAYLPGVTIPAGNRSDGNRIGPSQEFWSFDQRISVSKDFLKRWTMNADFGFSLPFGEKRREARGTFDANAAVGYQLLDWIQPEVEVNYAHDTVRAEPDADVIAVTVGVILPIAEHWRIDAGVQQVVSARNADKSTSASIALVTCW